MGRDSCRDSRDGKGRAMNRYRVVFYLQDAQGYLSADSLPITCASIDDATRAGELYAQYLNSRTGTRETVAGVRSWRTW
jgi:hypothetical protein